MGERLRTQRSLHETHECEMHVTQKMYMYKTHHTIIKLSSSKQKQPRLKKKKIQCSIKGIRLIVGKVQN